MCLSLAESDFNVSLIVADGLGNENRTPVKVLDVGKAKSRLDRMLNIPRLVLKLAENLNADLYHIHDPELIPLGRKLKKIGYRVIFDSHEDVEVQIRSKHYINRHVRIIISWLYGLYEKYTCKRFDAVVAATPFINDKFAAAGIKSINVNNYPILSEFNGSNVDWRYKKNQAVYIGGLSEDRGIDNIVGAANELNPEISIVLGGQFTSKKFETKLKESTGWKRVRFKGWLDRNSVSRVLEESMMGLVLLRPKENYLESLPVKMFEYMAAGIPIVASDFPLWVKIIKDNKCGIYVDPLEPSAIARGIISLNDNVEKAREMGVNGRNAIEKKFNWDLEKKKLIDLYFEVLS
jgi:glycosyltransferase involved in cell wall biosynthesis